jgi:hypothetical protein
MQRFVKNSYTGFYENSTNVLDYDTRSPKDTRSDGIYILPLLHRSESLNLGIKTFNYVNVTTNYCHKSKGKVPIPAMKTRRVPEGGKKFGKKYSGIISYCHSTFRAPRIKNSPSF